MSLPPTANTPFSQKPDINSFSAKKENNVNKPVHKATDSKSNSRDYVAPTSRYVASIGALWAVTRLQPAPSNKIIQTDCSKQVNPMPKCCIPEKQSKAEANVKNQNNTSCSVM